MKAKSQLDFAYAPPQRWGLAASDLLDIEDSGGWKKKGFACFSLYLENIAKTTNRTKSSLWRERTAGRYYNELRKRLDPTGKQLPRLDDPSVKASPESLELVGKISRVAPIELAEDLQRRAMKGEISRRDLRDIWETYRPVLAGRTARGRGIEAPRFDKKDREMERALLEANSLAPIVQNGPAWLGVKGAAYVYRVVHISGSETLSHLYPSTPDVVVLLARDEQSPLEIHGVEAGVKINDNEMLHGYDGYDIGVEFLWFATSKKLSREELATVPKEVGILLTTPDSVEVIRNAEEIYGSSDKQKELLKAILRESSRN